MGLGEGKRFALHHKAMKGFFFLLFFSVVGLLCVDSAFGNVLAPRADLFCRAVCLGGTGGAAHEALVHHLPSANTCSSAV